eukprot:355211-Chlamydomonas_euryale.AAC.4
MGRVGVADQMMGRAGRAPCRHRRGPVPRTRTRGAAGARALVECHARWSRGCWVQPQRLIRT